RRPRTTRPAGQRAGVVAPDVPGAPRRRYSGGHPPGRPPHRRPPARREPRRADPVDHVARRGRDLSPPDARARRRAYRAHRERPPYHRERGRHGGERYKNEEDPLAERERHI